MENVLITGATGFIGQHLLYETLGEFLREQRTGTIYLLIRRKPGREPAAYIRSMLRHAGVPSFIAQAPIERLMGYIRIVEGDMRDSDLAQVLARSIETHVRLQVFHSAGSINMHSNQDASEEVYQHNVVGTLSLMRALLAFDCRFMYISTAFSMGLREGTVPDEITHLPDADYRNPYERSKAETEQRIKRFAAENGMSLQIARPSVVVGRMLESPLYVTSKFDVIYGWARFFWLMKRKAGHADIRIHVNPTGRVNIVPVDYVAKACLKLCRRSDLEQLNVVASESIRHVDYISAILKQIGFDSYEFANTRPESLTGLERMYYRSVGDLFAPYFNSPDYEYETTVLRRLMGELSGADVLASMASLIGYAIEHDFDERNLQVGAERTNALACRITG